MKIQLLSLAGCPHAIGARAALVEALAQEHCTVRVEEVDIAHAPRALRGWGSPTILIDGEDIAGEQRGSGGVACRLYPTGIPTSAMIRRRLRSARSTR